MSTSCLSVILLSLLIGEVLLEVRFYYKHCFSEIGILNMNIEVFYARVWKYLYLVLLYEQFIAKRGKVLPTLSIAAYSES